MTIFFAIVSLAGVFFLMTIVDTLKKINSNLEKIIEKK